MSRMYSWKERLEHFTWTQFLYNIASGGIATMLGALPYQALWIRILGTIVFLYNFSIFMIFTLIMALRAYYFPREFLRSTMHPEEATFLPAYFLSWANILMGTSSYAMGHVGVWLVDVLRVLFWVYVGITFVRCVLQYVWLFLYEKRTFDDVSPSWCLLIFPPMLTGSIANSFASSQSDESARQMIFAGITFQALGFLVSLLIYAVLIIKFALRGAPPPSARPGMFIMVGPMAFSGLAWVGLGQIAQEKFGTGYLTDGFNGGAAFRMIGLWFGCLCWAMCFWILCVVTICVVIGAVRYRMEFKMGWYALVFPNCGFTILTIRLGTSLESPAIKWVGEIMAPVVVAVWLFLSPFYIKAIINEKIMVPHEDVDAREFKFDRQYPKIPTPPSPEKQVQEKQD